MKLQTTLLVLTAVTAGCLTAPNVDPPLYSAWIAHSPSISYDAIPTTIHTSLHNLAPPAANDAPIVGREICLKLDGAVPRSTTGAPLCNIIHIPAASTIVIPWSIPPMPAGVHTISVLNATTTIEVRTTPPVGSLITAPRAAIQLDHAGNDTWRFTIHYANGTTPLALRYNADGDRALPHSGGTTIYETPAWTVRSSGNAIAIAYADDGQGWPLGRHLFAWCCAN